MQEEGSASPSQPQGHLREHLFSSVNPCHRHLAQGLGAGAPVPRPEGPCSALALVCFCAVFAPPGGHRLYSKLNKEHPLVPGVGEAGAVRWACLCPHSEQMACVSSFRDLSLLLRHQISDPTDHKYSLGLQAWR